VRLILILCCLGGIAIGAEHAQVTPLMSKDLMDVPGREVSVITVTYAPGASDGAHRHNAHTFV